MSGLGALCTGSPRPTRTVLPSHQGEGEDKGRLGQKDQARLHKGSHRKLNCAGGWGECWGGVGGALEESASQGPHSGQAWLGPLLALAATHKKAGPSLLTQ